MAAIREQDTNKMKSLIEDNPRLNINWYSHSSHVSIPMMAIDAAIPNGRSEIVRIIFGVPGIEMRQSSGQSLLNMLKQESIIMDQ
jgi:hypothetical protein